MINMKKMLILAIMVFGLNTKVFAGYNMIEAIKVHEIACLKNPKEITKKEMKLGYTVSRILWPG